MAAKIRFNFTNNMSKYEACILDLRMAIHMNIHEILVIVDSNLLINAVKRDWVMKN